jgi:ketosteroid isomerase-like protein
MGDAYAKRDADAIAALYATDVVIKTPGMPDVKGRDAEKVQVKAGFSMFSDMQGGPSRIWIGKGVAVLELVITGTNTGDLPGMKATNRKMGVQGVVIDWFNDDGLIKEEHGYFDEATQMKQLDAKADAKTFRAPIASVPNSPPEVHVSKGTPDEQTLVTAVTGIYPTFDNHKEDAFLAYLTDATVWDDESAPGPMTGTKDGKAFFESFTGGFPDMKTSATPVVVADGFVIVEGTTSGTQKGDFMGIKATGKPINTHWVDVIQMSADGKTVQHGWTYENALEMMTQLGQTPGH